MSNLNKLMSEAQDLQRRGQLKAAKERYDTILEMSPRHASARLLRAIIFQTSGQGSKALSEAREAATTASDSDFAFWSNYGIVLKNAREYSEAQAAYRKALKISPQNSSVQSNLGSLLLLMGKGDEAEAVFTDLAERHELAAPWLNLARIYGSRGEISKFEKAVTKAY